MRDHEDGAAAGVEFAEEFHDLAAGGGVEVAGGLVGENHRRVVREGARDCHALALPAGQLARLVLKPVLHPDGTRQFDGAAPRLAFGNAFVEHGEGDVLGDGELRDEVEALEDEPQVVEAVGAEGVVVHAGDIDAAQPVFARGGAVEAAEDV